MLLLPPGCGKEASGIAQDGKAQPNSAIERQSVHRFWALYREALRAKEAGEWNEASRLFFEALQIEPEHQTSLYFLGTSLFEQGRYVEAGAAWTRLVETHPDHPAGLFQLGNLHACPEPGAPWDLDAAEREFEHVLRLNREQTGPMARLAEIALVRGDLDRAVPLFADVVRTNSVDAGSFYLLGYVSYLRGDIEGAAQYLGRAAVAIKGQSPVRGILGEGDSTARLRTTFPAKRLFAGLWLGLEEKGYGQAPTVQQAASEYAEALRYHESLAARLRGARVVAPARPRPP